MKSASGAVSISLSSTWYFATPHVWPRLRLLAHGRSRVRVDDIGPATAASSDVTETWGARATASALGLYAGGETTVRGKPSSVDASINELTTCSRLLRRRPSFLASRRPSAPAW